MHVVAELATEYSFQDVDGGRPPLHSKPPVPLANLPVPQGPAEGRRGLRRLRARLAAPHGDHARGEASVMIMRWNGCVSKIKSVRGDRPSFWGRQDLF